MKVKVFACTTYYGNKPTRLFVATASQQKAADLFGMTVRELHDGGTTRGPETNNPIERELALAEPGVVFMADNLRNERIEKLVQKVKAACYAGVEMTKHQSVENETRKFIEFSELGVCENSVQFVADKRLTISVENPWMGDTESGFGAITTCDLSKAQANELLVFLGEWLGR